MINFHFQSNSKLNKTKKRRKLIKNAKTKISWTQTNVSIGVVGAHGLDAAPVADLIIKSVDRDPASNKKVKKMKKKLYYTQFTHD